MWVGHQIPLSFFRDVYLQLAEMQLNRDVRVKGTDLERELLHLGAALAAQQREEQLEVPDALDLHTCSREMFSVKESNL